MGTLTHTTRPNMAPAVVFLTLLALCLPPTQGRGRLRNPASRASQWREGFDNPADYNDNQGFCGELITRITPWEGSVASVETLLTDPGLMRLQEENLRMVT